MECGKSLSYNGTSSITPDKLLSLGAGASCLLRARRVAISIHEALIYVQP